MTDILGTLAKQRRQFVPDKPMDYLALQLARKLSDEEAARYYRTLFEHHPASLLLRAFRQCCGQGKVSGPEFIRVVRELTKSES